MSVWVDGSAARAPGILFRFASLGCSRLVLFKLYYMELLSSDICPIGLFLSVFEHIWFRTQLLFISPFLSKSGIIQVFIPLLRVLVYTLLSPHILTQTCSVATGNAGDILSQTQPSQDSVPARVKFWTNSQYLGRTIKFISLELRFELLSTKWSSPGKETETSSPRKGNGSVPWTL